MSLMPGDCNRGLKGTDVRRESLPSSLPLLPRSFFIRDRIACTTLQTTKSILHILGLSRTQLG